MLQTEAGSSGASSESVKVSSEPVDDDLQITGSSSDGPANGEVLSTEMVRELQAMQLQHAAEIEAELRAAKLSSAPALGRVK